MACGIAPRTLRSWIAWGRGGEAPYDAVYAAVTRARCLWRAEMLARIRAGAARNWRAAAWALERLGGPRYRKRDERKPPGAPPTQVGVAIDLQPYREILRSIDAPPQGAPPGAPPAGLPQPSPPPSEGGGPRAAGG